MSKIDETYHKLLEHILKKGYSYEDPNRAGVERIEVQEYTLRHDFSDGFPAISTKELYWRGIVGELLWFLRGSTDIRELWKYNIHFWDKDWWNFIGHDYKYWKTIEDAFKDDTDADDAWFDMGRIYGAQWRNWIGQGHWEDHHLRYIDQISNLIKGLKETPMGTKHIVTAWNPAELDNMALPPCHWSFEILVRPITGAIKGGHLFIRDDKSEKGWTVNPNPPKYSFILKWHQRSVDTFLGLPFNIASYGLLAHIIGKMVNMVPEGIVGDLSNVHIYKPHLDAVKEQLSRSTNYFNSRTELDIYPIDLLSDVNISLNNKIRLLQTKHFSLTPYTKQPAIRAEMLAYNKK